MNPRLFFIHGLFLNSRSWENWIPWFEALGYRCEAPSWPGLSGDPALLREDPPANLGQLDLQAVYDHYHTMLVGQEPMILIGHSIGGLIVQKLIANGIGQAGVCIASVAPNGMLAADWGFFRNTVSITNPFAGDGPYHMTEELFHANFGNTMTEAASRAAFERYALPGSRQVLRDVLGSTAVIDVEKPHAPLLFMGAEEDAIIPSTLVARNAHAWTDQRSHSEYRSFSGRGHFICGQDGWEEVASSIANWLQGHPLAARS